MRKVLIVIALLIGLGAFSQNQIGKQVNELIAKNVSFKPYLVLEQTSAVPDAEAAKAVEKATFATLKTQQLAALVAQKDPYIEVSVPYNNSVITLQLYRKDIFAEGFHIDTDKGRSLPYEKGVYYRGIVKGDAQSVAALSFFNNELAGLVSAGSINNLVIGKLNRAQNTSDYIIYSDADMKVQNDFECHTSDQNAQQPAANRALEPASTKCVSMYFEMDYSLYTLSNSNTTTATNWMTAVFNNVHTLYNNDGISVALKSIYIWTTPDSYTGDSSSDYLEQFNDTRPIFDGDVGQLVGVDSGGLGGVAKTINGLCSSQNYSYSDLNYSFSTVPTYSWTIMVITHEFGHLLGSPHTHACVWNGNNTPIDSCGPYSIGSTGEGYNCMANPPILPSNTAKGSIMSYCHLVGGIGINLANGFGPQPKARVLQSVNAGTCLSTDCINTCINTVVAIHSVIDGATATISWDQLSQTTNWLVSVTPVSGPTAWVPVTGTSYIVTGLLPNTFYKIQVRPDCDAALTTDIVQNVFVTDAQFCDGVVITDSGGAAASYTNNEDYVRTIIPNVADQKIKLTFSSFFLLGQDRLYIHDGNSTAAPDLTAGGLTGNTLPGIFESTAADGSLTLHFVSDGTIVRPGFVAAVSCSSMLGTSGVEPNIDFSYSPNPSDGLVSIVSRTPITEVLVYNSIGQLLYQSNANSRQTTVDLGAFASGTYFFKLRIGSGEAHFKILRK